MWLLKLHFSISVLCLLTFIGFRSVYREQILNNGYIPAKKKLLSIEKKPRPQYVVKLNTCYPSIDVSSLIKAANTIKKGFENMFGILRNIEIVKVIFNEPATIVIWSDGTKTVVKAQNGEVFDREKGLAKERRKTKKNGRCLRSPPYLIFLSLLCGYCIIRLTRRYRYG